MLPASIVVVALAALLTSTMVVSSTIDPNAVDEHDVPLSSRARDGYGHNANARPFLRTAHTFKDSNTLQPDEEERGVFTIADELKPATAKLLQRPIVGKTADVAVAAAVEAKELAHQLALQYKITIGELSEKTNLLWNKLAASPTFASLKTELTQFVQKILNTKIGDTTIGERFKAAEAKKSFKTSADSDAVRTTASAAKVLHDDTTAKASVGTSIGDDGKLTASAGPGVTEDHKATVGTEPIALVNDKVKASAGPGVEGDAKMKVSAETDLVDDGKVTASAGPGMTEDHRATMSAESGALVNDKVKASAGPGVVSDARVKKKTRLSSTSGERSKVSPGLGFAYYDKTKAGAGPGIVDAAKVEATTGLAVADGAKAELTNKFARDDGVPYTAISTQPEGTKTDFLSTLADSLNLATLTNTFTELMEEVKSWNFGGETLKEHGTKAEMEKLLG
ncbi:unnamed protein product [Hyaloperonospora brassicae]|uniref:RxLR effector candidate protein n=1 Tax=Hyaloperonospora brassicae TaxID=162125 RepID=A0AAV0TSN2_HYABA|nr:unnamed protein product [Hyaloperonospora brassicae]